MKVYWYVKPFPLNCNTMVANEKTKMIIFNQIEIRGKKKMFTKENQ